MTFDKFTKSVGIGLALLTVSLLILGAVGAKSVPAEVKYTNTTYSAISVLDELGAQQALLDEQYKKAVNAVESNQQSICLQTVVVAQLKYIDTSASNLSENDKSLELERLSSVANDTRSTCPELFQMNQ
jgi:hypothetical protein